MPVSPQVNQARGPRSSKHPWTAHCAGRCTGALKAPGLGPWRVTWLRTVTIERLTLSDLWAISRHQIE